MPLQLTSEEIRNLCSLNTVSSHVSKFRTEEDNYLVSTGESKKFETIVGYFVDTITSKYDQDVSLLLVGNKGRGKSRAALSLCYYAGCELAERLGGRWDDYFDPYTHLAIISPKRATELMAIKDKYAVKDYDDIGIGWGARNWQQRENIEKGEVFQISRIDNQLQVFSVPHQFLLDKIPRTLVSHYAEMDQPFFDYGFTTMKMFKPLTLFREGKIIQPYLSVNRVKYVLYRIPKPPAFLDSLYTQMRKDATSEAMSARLGGKETKNFPKTEKSTATTMPALKPHQIIASHKTAILQISPPLTRAKVVAFFVERGITHERVSAWITRHKFAQAGIVILHSAIIEPVTHPISIEGTET